jgi:hypothetical protein
MMQMCKIKSKVPTSIFVGAIIFVVLLFRGALQICVFGVEPNTQHFSCSKWGKNFQDGLD